MNNEFSSLIKELKILAKNNTIPLMTVDGELMEVIYRHENKKEDKYQFLKSNNLINDIDCNIVLKNNC